MAQIITFPKQPRSELEQAIRQQIPTLKLNVPQAVLDHAIERTMAATEAWGSDYSVNFPEKVQLEAPSQEVLDEIQRIARLAGHHCVRAFWGKVIAERLVFEIRLAEAGVDWMRR